MPSPQERQKAIRELEAAESELREELCRDGDCFVKAFANSPPFDHEPTKQRAILAARVGFLNELVKRNEMRSDNA